MRKTLFNRNSMIKCTLQCTYVHVYIDTYVSIVHSLIVCIWNLNISGHWVSFELHNLEIMNNINLN